jgi:hypothetical protein
MQKGKITPMNTEISPEEKNSNISGSNNTKKSNIVELWKEKNNVPIPQKYESVAKEREKLIS